MGRDGWVKRLLQILSLSTLLLISAFFKKNKKLHHNCKETQTNFCLTLNYLTNLSLIRTSGFLQHFLIFFRYTSKLNEEANSIKLFETSVVFFICYIDVSMVF